MKACLKRKYISEAAWSMHISRSWSGYMYGAGSESMSGSGYRSVSGDRGWPWSRSWSATRISFRYMYGSGSSKDMK